MAGTSWWERHNPGGTHWEGAAGDYMRTKWGKKERRAYSGSYANTAVAVKLKEAHNSQVRFQGSSNVSIREKSSYKHLGQETNEKLLGMRKEQFESHFYGQKGMNAWKGNEWMKKALDQAWNKDEFGIRSVYGGKYASTVSGNTGGEGGENYSSTKAGYGMMNSDTLRQLTHTYAAKAQEMFGTAQEQKATDKMLAERKARGGMGSRGSTLLTGGREGVLGKANVKRKTLIGSQEEG